MMSNTMIGIMERFADAKRNGRGFMARCPAHDDKTPSLSIAESEDGGVLLKCHAGCPTEDVVRAAGLKMSDLFPEKPVGERHRSPIKDRPQPAHIDDQQVSQFHAALPTQGRDYLKAERLLTDEVIDRYELGIHQQHDEKRITLPIRDEHGQVCDIRRWLPHEARKDEACNKILHWAKGYGAPHTIWHRALQHRDPDHIRQRKAPVLPVSGGGGISIRLD
jgi:hypothetical protein